MFIALASGPLRLCACAPQLLPAVHARIERLCEGQPGLTASFANGDRGSSQGTSTYSLVQLGYHVHQSHRARELFILGGSGMFASIAVHHVHAPPPTPRPEGADSLLYHSKNAAVIRCTLFVPLLQVLRETMGALASQMITK